MIYRNFIAPSRDFTQVSNEILRHPRLNSDAVRILNWQLSLPPHSRNNLSDTAKRAGIGATSFATAKRQLKAEGYVHERRVQVGGGLWVTQQLVSSRPLRAEEAAKVFGQMPLQPGSDRVFSQVAPSDPVPAVGSPAAPSTDRHPDMTPEGKTSNHPPEAEGGSEQVREEVMSEARQVISSLPLHSPLLRHIPPGMRDELTRLAVRWLLAGHSPADVREHVLRALPRDGTPVHRPGGLLRFLLREVPPVSLPAVVPPSLSPRLLGARECDGDRHMQPMLFRPVGDEELCPACVLATAPACT